MSNQLVTAAEIGEAAEQLAKPVKVASRPGSQWATGKRKQQKGFTQPKDFARGARTKPR